ncbi:MAG: TetR/AcrR family transcriptional regulator [Steroidobacterales bacterium]|jgi:AcrR family transcriptional regulator
MYFRNPIPNSLPRERLLDAAERAVLETGAGHLTLDAVAKFAGVSKGGLLHHFPSKDALLEAMLERYLKDIETQVAERCAGRGGTLTAIEQFRERVRVLLEQHPERRAAGAALIAASADKPDLMAHCRAEYREVLDELAALPGGFERSALVLLAVDGLLLGELLRLSPYTPEERSRLVKALLKAVDQCGRIQ